MYTAVTVSRLYLMSREYLNLAQTGAEIWRASSNLIEKNVGCERHIAQTGYLLDKSPSYYQYNTLWVECQKMLIAPA